MRKTKTIERYDASGNLIERIVETEETYEAVQPSYVQVTAYPVPQPQITFRKQSESNAHHIVAAVAASARQMQ